jgi:hypothetical protein
MLIWSGRREDSCGLTARPGKQSAWNGNQHFSEQRLFYKKLKAKKSYDHINMEMKLFY